MKFIDQLIDRVTMYRLLLYYLGALLLAAMLFGALGMLSYSPYAIAISASLFLAICYVTNYVFAKLYGAPSNTESSILTALILALIITPVSSYKDVMFIAAASGLAIASKYIIAIKNKHIFNPAAIAVVLTAFGPQESASWWVGSAVLVPFVVIGGLLVSRKLRRTTMIAAFLIAAFLSVTFFAALNQRDVMSTLQTTILHSSLFFLAFAMLTEPWTSPSTKKMRYVYAVLVGALFSPLIQVAGIFSTPELALVVGNFFAFLVSPIVKTKVAIRQKWLYGQRTEDIELVPEYRFSYKPGQYIEMTLPHSSSDSRGYRRYFTLASSPTEENLRIGVRYYDNGSTFKRHLQQGDTGKGLSVGQVGGDFILPQDRNIKLAFIAGGIGITPFRSMVKYLSDSGDDRSVALLYGERSDEDVAYAEVFEEARAKIGVETKYILATAPTVQRNNTIIGVIDRELIERQIPDFLERVFYISGPQPMVETMRQRLKELGVPAHQIKVDYFFGYA